MTEIDRGESGSKGRKGKKLTRIITATLIVATLFAASVSLLPGPSSDVPPASTPVRISYSTHTNIIISGNAGFLGLNASTGISNGSGTASDPYIIEGWEMDLTSESVDAGINIQNADVHFVIRDCYIHDGIDAFMIEATGIYLNNCRNGTIHNNSLTDNSDGINLFKSSNNILSDNNCSLNSGSGIFLSTSSNGNTLINNTCSGAYYGISLMTSCSNNTLTNNTCPNDSEGIRIDSSSNGNTLADNTCSHNTIHGIDINGSSGNTVTNNTCTYNTNSGILVYSSSATGLFGNNASWNSQFGVYLWLGSGTIASNNTISNNSQYGIRINSAPSNVISNNTVSDNIHYAVYIWNAASQKNRIWNNTFYHNNGSGDSYLQSENQALDSGGANWWNSTNGYGNYWADWTTPDVVPEVGIVDLPYNITGTRHAKDYYPLTTPGTPIPEFSDFIVPIVGLMLISLIFTRARKKL